MVYRIFSDESRQSKDRFMMLAGIILPQENIEDFNSTMAKYRREHNMKSELKWSKVTKQKLNEYKIFVDYFFALCNTDKIHFRSIILDNHKVNHKKFNSGNKEVGFYKFYYQLFLLFGREYFNEEENSKFIVHPDYRNTKYRLNDLKDILNRGMAKKKITSSCPFVSIEPLDSKKSEEIQLLDIILGAIGYVKNGYMVLAKSSKAKIELCDYISSKAGIDDLGKDTPFRRKRFTVWNFPLE